MNSYYNINIYSGCLPLTESSEKLISDIHFALKRKSNDKIIIIPMPQNLGYFKIRNGSTYANF